MITYRHPSSAANLPRSLSEFGDFTPVLCCFSEITEASRREPSSEAKTRRASRAGARFSRHLKTNFPPVRFWHLPLSLSCLRGGARGAAPVTLGASLCLFSQRLAPSSLLFVRSLVLCAKRKLGVGVRGRRPRPLWLPPPLQPTPPTISAKRYNLFRKRIYLFVKKVIPFKRKGYTFNLNSPPKTPGVSPSPP